MTSTRSYTFTSDQTSRYLIAQRMSYLFEFISAVMLRIHVYIIRKLEDAVSARKIGAIKWWLLAIISRRNQSESYCCLILCAKPRAAANEPPPVDHGLAEEDPLALQLQLPAAAAAVGHYRWLELRPPAAAD